MTFQVNDRLWIKRKTHDILNYPYLPESDPRIVTTEILTIRSSCSRGYVASWKLKYGKLFLMKLEGDYRLYADEPIFAGWYSGPLYIPSVETHWFRYFSPEWESDSTVTCIRVSNGVVVDMGNGKIE